MESGEEYLKISPHYDVRKLIKPTLEDYIDIFEDRVQGWMIDSARILTNYEHAGWSVLQVIVAYFELITIFMRGEDSNRRSEEFFGYGLLSVFPEIETVCNEQDKARVAQIMYKDLRCGLYHTGLARPRIWLISSPYAILVVKDQEDPGDGSVVYKIGAIKIDAPKFVDRIEVHFKEYIRQLRDPSQADLRARFQWAFTTLYH